ncbi:MAG TPA: glycosyltransferase family 2 protein [Actinophytocola sp.]|uniref:glycosyltransferase family 2 protein n=1 Tax=Actinophytocola sp. TaxID=1872138 RepID=UPI002DDD64BD|nr:glycosyltransferase family 2 protein [Actinophytocola sp.]HEV2777796.1 glycosyltransferase family 2 protein [Actinophytocola sp.]
MKPLVSCIMPTYNRRAFVPHAIRYFLRQDYPERELVVVDDGEDPVEDLIPADYRISYIRLPERHTIGAKHNIGCRLARGELAVIWDDDDWMAPWRLSYQVAEFLGQDVDVSGSRVLLYLDLRTGQGWRYEYPRRERPWVATPTFCFLREYLLAKPFPDEQIAFGTDWLWSPAGPRIGTLANPRFYVATIHSGNVATKSTSSTWWHPRPQREITGVLGDDWPLTES